MLYPAAMKFASAVTLGLVLFSFACSKKEAPPAPQPAAKELRDSGPLEKLAAPDGVLAFGGIDRPVKAFQQLNGFLSKAAGAHSTPEMATRALARNLGLKHSGAIDLSRPIRFVVLAPERYPGSRCISFATQGRKALVAALPKTKQLAGKASYRFTDGNGQEVYLDLIDDFAIVCHNGRFFKDKRDFIVRLLGSNAQGKAVAMVVAKNVAKAYAKDIQAIPKRLKRLTARSKGMPGVARLFAESIANLGDIDTMRLGASEGPGNGLLASIQIQAKGGSPLAKRNSNSKNDATKLARLLPASTMAALLLNLDPQGPGPLTQSLHRWLFKMAWGQAPPAMGKGALQRKQQRQAYLDATTGEFALAMFQTEEGTSQTLLITRLRNAAAAKKSMAKLLSSEPDGTKKRPRKMAARKKKLARKFRPEAYRINEEPVAVVEHPWVAASKQSKPDPSAAGAAKRALKDSFSESHIAYRDNLQLIVFGRQAKPTVKRWLEAKLRLGFESNPAFLRAKKLAAKNPSILLLGAPMALARGLQFRQLKPLLDSIPSKNDGSTMLALSMGNEDQTIQLQLDVPAEQARAVVQLMTLSRGLR